MHGDHHRGGEYRRPCPPQAAGAYLSHDDLPATRSSRVWFQRSTRPARPADAKVSAGWAIRPGVADPAALREEQNMLAGLDEVLTVTQDQQHPAADYLAWTAEVAVAAASWPRDVRPWCFADRRATVRAKGTGMLKGIKGKC